MGSGARAVALLLSLSISISNSNSNFAPSVLLVVVDDLRAPLLAPELRAPNFRSVAEKGYAFENAFAQLALCAPSRNSFLTSRRPDTLRLYDFYNYWRDFAGNFTTVPQYFKDSGYATYSFGKVFHPGKSSNFTDDYPYSWSEPPYHPSTEIYANAKVCTNTENGEKASNLICPVRVDFQPEKSLPDIQIKDEVVRKLKRLKSTKRPYFLAVGFHKPHIPLKFPEKYLDFYPIKNIRLPKMPFKPPSMPTVAWNPWIDVKRRDDINNLNISFPFGIMPDDWTVKIKQSYYASVTYIDDLFGEILEHVDMDNTIIIITSDHGWSLGEHGEWAKYSNFDNSLRVPLIIYDPEEKNIKHNKISNIVELIDLFPTIAELAGIVDNFPKCIDKTARLCSEGRSLVPLMKKQKRHVRFARSQFPRPSTYPTYHPSSDKPKLNEIKIMGYTIRTKRFRYTEWVKFNNTSFEPNWHYVYAKELYDHLIDPEENLNLADRNEMNHIMEMLSEALKYKTTYINI